MPQSQNVKVNESVFQSIQAPEPVSAPVDVSQIELSLSQLLGYDYVFMAGETLASCFAYQNSAISVISQLVDLLDVTPEQSVFIHVSQNDNAEDSFCRYDITWAKGQIETLETTRVTNTEQREFINMIWQCSSELVV